MTNDGDWIDDFLDCSDARVGIYGTRYRDIFDCQATKKARCSSSNAAKTCSNAAKTCSNAAKTGSNAAKTGSSS